MLTGSKTTFKVRQLVPDMKERMLSHSSFHTRGRDVLGLCCLPGECVLQRAVLVRKKLSVKEGSGWLSGTLFCTHFRVAFVPQDSQRPDDNADPVLLGDHDVALASIDKVVAVGPSRTKLVTPNGSLKFTPEELVLYCRDLRVFCFLFDRLTPDAQAMEITYTIAKTYQPLKPGTLLSFQNSALGSIEMKQFLSNRRRDPNMNWFECSADWEQELERAGATGWRVSSVNDRFEMSTSLPRFTVVPHRVLDTELKKTFAHFNDGRIPRWCWRHPRGSDLLRMASFQNNIYHEKDDIRNLELVLFGGQQMCVIVDLGEEMPSPADIQVAHTRLRTLCLGDISSSVSVPDDKWLSTLESTRWLDYIRCFLRKAAEVACLLRGGHMTVVLQESEDRDMNCVVSSLVQVMCDPHCRTVAGFQSLVQKEWITAGHKFLSRINYHRDCDKEEAPVFLLFLDCVWQLWSQYPTRFQLTEEYLLALHDSVQLPLFSSFLANSQRERCRRSQHLPQSYTPVNGLRELPMGEPEEPVDPPFPPVWDWALQYSSSRRARFTQPVSQAACIPPVLNGNLNTNLERSWHSDGLPGSVFLLSRSSFSNPSNLLPWRSGNSGSYWKSHRRAPSSEGLSGLERLIRACSLSDPSENTTTLHDPFEPLLPLLIGPCVRVWRGCYLRGALHPQAFSHPMSSCSQHPLDQLAFEVQELGEKLAQASVRHPEHQTRQQEPRRLESNLNQNANNGTFLFSSRSSQHQPPASRGSTRPTNLTRAPWTASEPPRSAQRISGKHTFLFGHQQESQSVQRYIPSPSAKYPKHAGNTH
ncbi:myotubularin-related protein 11 [Triplophysa rosa]|uniref:Myotubularin-related protein 11 n=1 Tax=Triplophysa rosa TaxID=992332 RepID=A0A9W7WQD1_TRIRA|nr:myotubularin-related protein 11 [Triplophysa rosa]KAI7806432.1 putative myotubularin-related protein 11 [Triplophysa rosa]